MRRKPPPGRGRGDGSPSRARTNRPERWDRDPWFDRDATIDAESWFDADPRLRSSRETRFLGRAAPQARGADGRPLARRAQPGGVPSGRTARAGKASPGHGQSVAPSSSRARKTDTAGPPAARGLSGTAAGPRRLSSSVEPRYEPRHVQPRRRRLGLGSRGRARAFGLLGAIVLAFAAIGVKLSFIQGVHAQQYLAVGKSEWTSSITLPGERGAILDRNGDELAMSIPMPTIFGDPHEISKANAVSDATALSPILGLPVSTLETQLSEDNGFVYLARTVPKAEAAKVSRLNLPGIATMQEPKRIYPAGQLASSLLGSVGIDDTGLGGLEYQDNSILTGRSGKLVEETDPQGRAISGGVQEYKAPVAGDDLVLSLDEPLQYDAEQALARAIVFAKAQSGIVLLMDSKTGEILADANLTMPGAGTTRTPAVPVNIPSPTATNATEAAASTKKAPQVQPVEAPLASAFTQTYEPGSVNKLITISAALQEGVIQPANVFTIPDTYYVGGTPFHDSESHGTQNWSVTSILANSSNIGTIQIAQKLGPKNLLKYIHAYGEGSRTDIAFPGESAGLLPTYWSGTTLPTVAFGQGIGVTAVQMLAAYNTIANDGVYVAPKLIDGVVDTKGQEHPTPPSARHRIVSSKVAAEMTTMLDQVVQVGTGKAATMTPYTVAGKTGTALVPKAKSGGYIPGHYVASFAGFVPSEKPAITALVMINNTIDYGAQASAPTFATIARDALQELKIPPQKQRPPAPGVPTISAKEATGAGEVAGAPLPGLSTPVRVAPSNSAAPPTSATTTAPNTTTPNTTTPNTTTPNTTIPSTTDASSTTTSSGTDAAALGAPGARPPAGT